MPAVSRDSLTRNPWLPHRPLEDRWTKNPWQIRFRSPEERNRPEPCRPAEAIPNYLMSVMWPPVVCLISFSTGFCFGFCLWVTVPSNGE